MSEPQQEKGSLAAMAIFSLTPEPSKVTKTPRDIHIADVARDVQMTAVHAPMAAISTQWNGARWATDRVTEIMGRIGASGEQIALALAASRDARRWPTEREPGVPAPPEEVMAVRAHAEMVTYWALGAAHGLGNVLLRMLWLHTDARPIIEAAYPKAKSFPPFSEDRNAWEALGSRLITNAQKAASAAGPSPVDEIVAALDDLVQDPRWDGLMQIRGVNFHQWRPQTVGGGTPKHSMVKQDAAGRDMITVGTRPTNVAPNHELAIAAADDGLDALVEAAIRVDQNVFEGLNDMVGVEIFGT